MIVAKIWYKSQYATNFFGQPFKYYEWCGNFKNIV